jgi:hypothetical protein
VVHGTPASGACGLKRKVGHPVVTKSQHFL